MNYFLVKADPETDYSIDNLERDGQTEWTGVHSNAAIGFIKKMRPVDHVFMYHSGKEKSIVGMAEVAGEPYLNKDDPRTSWAVTLKFVKKFQSPVTLAQIKAEPKCQDFALVRQSRLSVMPVPAELVPWLFDNEGGRLK